MSKDPYRHFEDDAEAPAEAPRATNGDIDLVASTNPFRIYALRSDYPLDVVLTPGYFDDLGDVGLGKHDEIRVVANHGGVGEHALMTVSEVTKHGAIVVSLLVAYQRAG